ncbi:RTL1 [Hepatospora eriocheir]|uniref:RTL1 n=1 Tax=Hepatospora eriocheir TaxID=1081669 RepID=A0A1X0QB54_9MICR|nr:RTL1 [Hepatospora eriocheir]
MHFSDKISTITDKLKGSKKFVWSREDTDIIESIIKDIEKQTLLYHPNYSMPFELRTDASNVAISAILTQDNKLVGIYSKKLSESELKYSTVEKEF